MKTIILTRGIQGSGKSTWAKKWVNEKPMERVRINFDDLRNMMGPYNVEDWKPREKLIKEMYKSFLRKAMRMQYDIVIDNMNLSDSAVNTVKDIINEFNKENINNSNVEQYQYEFKDFFIDVKVCIERDSMRANPIGEKVIRKTWRTYRQKILQIENQKAVDSLNKIPYQPELPSCIILDMDSTICFNTNNRPYFGEGAADGMLDDIPNKGIINLIKQYIISKNKKDKIFIITGREQTSEIVKATYDYIKKYVGEYTSIDILFRPIGENMSGDKMKIKLIEDNIIGKYNIQYAIDDSKKIVNAYRQRGILTLQCIDGQF